MEKFWIDVKGYEGLYLVSNYGEVRSYPLVRIDKNGIEKLYKGKVLKGHIN